ncbi:MAG TPA: tRNA pseudouridine(38-40) synthase TruA [Longimicrobiaceae bacterium]|nr:tRNA pseudouridine(38-40) synthase TruA [Longimicrobiaceae bacterium]
MAAPETHRIALTLHYDGAAFFGWQLQPDAPTVQGELERVLSRLLDAPTRVIGSGRTDRGVHATGQVAAVDAPLRWAPGALRRALNALLPPEIWVADARLAAPDLHPRYDAVRRAYVYRVGLVPQARSPFHSRYCWPLAEPLDLAAMTGAARALPGEHSFRAFAKAGQEERGDRCTVFDARWAEWPGLGVEFHVAANRFLHHMVRYLVGTMVDIGRGRRPAADLAVLLEPDSSFGTSPPAPPEGLFLRHVAYPPESFGAEGPPPVGPADLP